jgi:hypothetical protein
MSAVGAATLMFLFVFIITLMVTGLNRKDSSIVECAIASGFVTLFVTASICALAFTLTHL